MYALIIMAWITGDGITVHDVKFDTQELCVAAKTAFLKDYNEVIQPYASTRVVATCVRSEDK